jgi:hypothetical protein
MATADRLGTDPTYKSVKAPSDIGKATKAWPYIQWISTVYNSRVCCPSFFVKYPVDVELYCISCAHWCNMFSFVSKLHNLDMVWMSCGCSLWMNEFKKPSFITYSKSWMHCGCSLWMNEFRKSSLLTNAKSTHDKAQQLLLPHLFLYKRYRFLQNLITWEWIFICNYKVLVHMHSAMNYLSGLIWSLYSRFGATTVTSIARRTRGSSPSTSFTIA